MKYAKVENNIVTNVTEVASDDELLIWTGHLGNPSKWKEVEGQVAIGWTYSNNTFTPVKPFPSWTLNGNQWQAPVTFPDDGKGYDWNEATTNWVEVT